MHFKIKNQEQFHICVCMNCTINKRGMMVTLLKPGAHFLTGVLSKLCIP